MNWKYAENLKVGDVIEVPHGEYGQQIEVRIPVVKVEFKRSGIHSDIVINGNYTFWNGDRVSIVPKASS